MQDDRNLVIYDRLGAAGTVFWATMTVNFHSLQVFLQLKDDGNLVMYEANGMVYFNITNINITSNSC